MKQSSDEKITASMAQNKNKYYLVAYPFLPLNVSCKGR
jgi:hypothetical protein